MKEKKQNNIFEKLIKAILIAIPTVIIICALIWIYFRMSARVLL